MLMSAQMWFKETPNGIVIFIKAQPKASRTEIAGLYGDPPRLKIRLKGAVKTNHRLSVSDAYSTTAKSHSLDKLVMKVREIIFRIP